MRTPIRMRRRRGAHRAAMCSPTATAAPVPTTTRRSRSAASTMRRCWRIQLDPHVAEDAGAPSGAVGSLVSAFTGGITDVDSGASKGIAITGSNQTNGIWYYTTNGGTTWTAVGTVSNTSALSLADMPPRGCMLRRMPTTTGRVRRP